ncbi:MAG TPA: SDR family NAD(P)-dependent oxidoreductase [Ktedonobacterales bacterium]|nr:SDR family NAD(P)-dependent oxidoreductase [Ktedonobacterales bacterium]
MTTPQSLPLAGKRAVVTGASRGIGRSIALALANAGADVAVTARTKAELDELADEIARMGRQAIAIACDVTNQRQVQTDLASRVLGAWRGIDILVNNAGASGSAKFLGHDDELWHRMLDINLTSVYYVTKAFVPAMVAQRSGRIITIASIAARTGAKYIAAYAASKHGVLGLMRALAVELNPSNITVNCVCPGYVDTPMTDRSIANVAAKTGMGEQQAREALEKMSPQGRLVQPEEVARIAVFLADPASASITGQAINVDGGSVMS